MKKVLFILVICLVSSISVFSQSKKKWEKAQSENSITYYRYFIARYPDGKYTELAKQELDQLEFLNAKQQNTVKAYEDYLKRCPDGKNSELAKQNIEQLEFLNAQQLNTIKSYEDFLKIHPDGKNSELAKLSLDQLSFKESEILNSENAYESYLSKFPNGQSKSIAITNLQEIRFINARKIKTVEAYENFLKLYPDGANAEQLRKELNGIRKFEESRKLGEVALRMAPKGVISFFTPITGGSMQATGTEINFPATLNEDIETFRRLINDGVDPNLIRIQGFEPAGSKDIGNGYAMFSSGNPGTIVTADEGGMTLLEYFTANKLEEACKILQQNKQK
jgi:tetratricopeptide (TPR) repeat protein